MVNCETDPQLYDAIIVGAGLTGLATAVGLFERGITNIAVIEKARALAPVGASIAIFDNGLRALEHISPSVAEKMRLSCIPVEKLLVKDEEGNFLHEKQPQARVHYMVWYLLQQYLKERLPPGILRLGQRVDAFEFDKCNADEIITIHTSCVEGKYDDAVESNASATSSLRAKVLIAADGIKSIVRTRLFTDVSSPKLYHGKVSYRAVLPSSALLRDDDGNDCDTVPDSRKYIVSKGVNTTFQGEEKGKIFSYRETSPGIFTVTAMAPVQDPTEDYRAIDARASKDRFCQVFRQFTAPEVQQILAATPDSVLIDPIHDIEVLDCWSRGNAIVIGDAAHAMSPSMGQGANIGLEDASVLVYELEKAMSRKPNVTGGYGPTLTKVWQSRIDRVKKIHSASRARSFANNMTSKAKPIDLGSNALKELLIEINNWHPPVDCLSNLASLPPAFDVLGAKLYGEYDVLEFQTLADRVDEFLQLGPDDVLIKIYYTDVNPVDLQKLRGRGNTGCPIENPPHVPGYGGSGIVIDVGSAIQDDCMATSWKGELVCFLGDPTRLGSYATHIVVNVNCVAKIPRMSSTNHDSSMLRDCACIPVAGLTAYESLAKCGLVKTCESSDNVNSGTRSVLIVGAAGGVGSWVLTMARALHPRLEIIATASSQVQQDWCTSLGADQVIKHDEILSKLEGGRDGSVDAIICLAEPTQNLFGALSDVVKPYGTICLVVAGKSISSLNLGFCFFKCVDVKMETVFSSIRTKFRHIAPARELRFIVDMLVSAKIKAPLSPELENEHVSECFENALSENGVLKTLSKSTGRRGNLVMKIQ